MFIVKHLCSTTTTTATTTIVCFMAHPGGLCQGLPGRAGTRNVNQEGKTNLDLLEIVSGSGISWSYANLHLAPDR